jgi:large subunit ribosomal protein L24e
MVKCSFSGEEIPPGKGIMFVRTDGRILYFKNRKAEKNYLKLHRKPRETKWTKFYAKGVKSTQE